MLRRKGKSHKAKETRGKYSKGKSIRKRDKSVYSRQESGRREADTAVSSQGESKACFAALAERKTRFYIAVKIPGRKAETMENAIVAALSAFPCAAGQDHYLRPGCGVRQLAPYGRTVALRGLLYRPVLRLAERRKRESERSASGVLSQRQEPFPCCPATLKRDLALLNARPRKVLNFHSAHLW